MPIEVTGYEANLYTQCYEAWFERNRRAMLMMYNMCDEEVKSCIAHCKTIKGAYETLQKQYDDTGFTAKHQATQRIIRITMWSCNDDVETYTRQMQMARDELKFLGSDLPDSWFLACLIINLEGRFENLLE